MAQRTRLDRTVELDGEEIRVTLEPLGGGRGELAARAGGGEPLSVSVLRRGATPVVLVGGRVIALSLGEAACAWRGATHRARVLAGSAQRRGTSGPTHGAGVVAAPMPGRVVELRVAVGQSVERGSPLAVIEAMKMQNELFAPGAGVVKRILVVAGDAVERGAALVEIG